MRQKVTVRFYTDAENKDVAIERIELALSIINEEEIQYEVVL